MSGEHYFSAEPAGDFKPKTIRVNLLGKEVQLQTAGGVFSPDHLDTGTAILLDHVDEAPISGNLLDIGCGWGPIAIALALQAPSATIWAVDVNQRSLELTRTNAELLGLKNIKACLPEEVPSDIRFSGIWSNPPIRVGKAELHSILNTWLPRLAEECESYLVVAKDLGADSLLKWLQSELPENFDAQRIDSAKGFRIIRVTRD
jgi:16S rRNA G1207 methylase RsmC